jgi:hypothetical protein
VRKRSPKKSSKRADEKPIERNAPEWDASGRVDRIERIHQHPGVRAEHAASEPPLRFQESDDLETLADVARRTGRHTPAQ